MVAIIRFARHGCTNRPFYHMVVIHNKRARNSRKYLEQLGTYDPMPNNHNEKLVSLNIERIKFWLASGAQMSKSVSMLLGLSGFLPVHPTTYIWARRARNKAEAIARMAEEAEREARETEETKEDDS
ncbi:28S ribosomal protein S16, mitochondrial [Holothuria leucospilota]|uniref:Small ribosomal subunit protein bS16m n=1 Tax=Holothuria leucospilota TaxID=206669 RepID=A0A9Q1BMY0_HOLLE|nr:28S ribosomal protein S16, mitochondrial [Holothuria leucospilota]